jgi:hypothetical protein
MQNFTQGILCINDVLSNNNLQIKHEKELLPYMFWPKMSTWIWHTTVSGLTDQHQTEMSTERVGTGGFIYRVNLQCESDIRDEKPL